VVQFGEKDVVRHNLVQQIIRAYEEFEAANPQNRAASENGKANGRGKESEKQQTKDRTKEIRQG
jgi:hypothetical protein